MQSNTQNKIGDEKINQPQKAVKTIVMMMIISVAGKILGLIREMLFGYNFGTMSIEGTAFTYASNIPNQFLDIMFASSITSSFIPIFNSKLKNNGKKAAFDLFNNFLSIIILVTGTVVLFSMIFSMPIVDLLASGLDYQTKMLTSRLLKIVFPVLMFSGIAFAMTGVLQSFGEFNIPSAMSMLFNGVIIFYYLFLIKKFGVYGLAISFTLGWILQFLIQLPFLRSQNYKFHFGINLKSDGIQQILKLMLPVLISSWVVPINNMVNSNTASYILGGANALRMANTVYFIVTGTFVLSVNNFVFQKMSKLKAMDNTDEFTETLKKSIGSMFYFLVPLTFVLMIFSNPIINILFERGKFNAEATSLTSTALFFYSIGIIGYGLQTILNSDFYASKNGKIPLVAAIMAVVINFMLSGYLAKFMGIGGPALASAVSIDTAALFMLTIENENRFGFLNRNFMFTVAKIFVSSACMGAFDIFMYKILFLSLAKGFISKFLFLFGVNLCGLAIYIFITYLFKIDEAIYVKKTLSGFFKRFQK